MAIPNQASSSLLLASQLVVEPICSWRSQHNPQLELKVFGNGENIRYSAYNHHPSIKCYWPSRASSPIDLISVFAHCVWKGVEGPIENRLFRDRHMAVLVSVNPRVKKIGIKEWSGNYLDDFLITRNLVKFSINKKGRLEFQEEVREIPRDSSYKPEAEEGMMRSRRTPKGDLALFEGRPVNEETVKVWPGDRDIRLIKLVAGNSQERIICRVFDWKNSKNSETFCRVAPGGEAEAEFDLPSIDTIIEQMQEYTPQLEIIGNKELVTFYRERPLDCFMPDYVLSRTRPMDVENWVCNQFYRKGGENSERFEYTNFVSAKKIVFSFGENKKEQRDINMKSFEIETWHVEIKRQVGWALQLPIGIYEFFSGMFLAGAQYPSEVDKKAMERLVQGVPMIDEERNKTVDDFAMELGACSTINFYMACDRSESQLEINGRIWVRSFGSAGRGIRSVLGNTVGRAANLLGAMRLEDVNRRLENVARLGENANRAVRAWEAVRGNPPPQENPQAN